MNLRVQELLKDGFKIDGRTRDAVRMSRGSDHRIILSDGTMKRGKPNKRNWH